MSFPEEIAATEKLIRSLITRTKDDAISLNEVRQLHYDEIAQVEKKGHPERRACAVVNVKVGAFGIKSVERLVYFDNTLDGSEGFIARCKATLRRHAADDDHEPGRGFIFTRKDRQTNPILDTIEDEQCANIQQAIDELVLKSCLEIERMHEGISHPESTSTKQGRVPLSQAIAALRALKSKQAVGFAW